MGSIKVEYLIERSHKGKKRRYFSPKKLYIVNGEPKECPIKCIRLPDNEVEAIAEAKRLKKQLDAWRAGEKQEPAGKGGIAWLVQEYQKSSRFKELAPGTQNLYCWNFPHITNGPLRRIPADKVTRQMVMQFYESLQATGKKRFPSQVMQVARVVFQFAEDMGYAPSNPFAHQRVAKAAPRRMILTPEQIAAARAKALELGLPSIARAIQIGIDAGQRPGDIRELPRNAYDGQWLRVRQSKTGALVDIPVYKMPVLKAELDAIAHDSLLILHEERTQQPYSKDMLCRRVREVFAAAGLGNDVQFRDLRRAAVVRLAEAGCTIPEICAITGHSLKEATEILKVYLPMTRALAEHAADKVSKLEVKK